MATPSVRPRLPVLSFWCWQMLLTRLDCETLSSRFPQTRGTELRVLNFCHATEVTVSALALQSSCWTAASKLYQVRVADAPIPCTPVVLTCDVPIERLGKYCTTELDWLPLCSAGGIVEQ